MARCKIALSKHVRLIHIEIHMKSEIITNGLFKEDIYIQQWIPLGRAQDSKRKGLPFHMHPEHHLLSCLKVRLSHLSPIHFQVNYSCSIVIYCV